MKNALTYWQGKHTQPAPRSLGEVGFPVRRLTPPSTASHRATALGDTPALSVALAGHLFPSPPSRSSRDTGACGISRATAKRRRWTLDCGLWTYPRPSLPICPAHLQKNINHFFENPSNLKSRQMPFNPAFLLQNPPHTLSPLTPCGSALCAISAGQSALNEIPKSPRVSRCPATALKVNRAKRHEKNSQFVSKNL